MLHFTTHKVLEFGLCRENFPYNKRDVLQSCHSPLVFVELKVITHSSSLFDERCSTDLIKVNFVHCFVVNIFMWLLQDIVNSDTFMGLLTEQEQHQLMKHLSPADSKPDRLVSAFFKSGLHG